MSRAAEETPVDSVELFVRPLAVPREITHLQIAPDRFSDHSRELPSNGCPLNGDRDLARGKEGNCRSGSRGSKRLGSETVADDIEFGFAREWSMAVARGVLVSFDMVVSKGDTHLTEGVNDLHFDVYV